MVFIVFFYLGYLVLDFLRFCRPEKVGKKKYFYIFNFINFQDKRQHNKLKYNSESERLKRELALLLSKKTALSSLLGKDLSPKKGTTSNETDNDDIFKLPALPERKDESDLESDEESSSGSIIDLHSVDIESENFKNLPVKDKYDLLLELKETRKMNSWGRIHELPKKSDNFSDFQLQRLLKRRKVQECLEETEKEMGDGGMSIIEIESLLNEEGIDTKIETLATHRIASNNTTRFLLINNMKQALTEAKKKINNPEINEEAEETNKKKHGNTELEDDLEKAIKMSLECADDHNQSNYNSKTDDSWTSVLTDSDYTEETDSEGDNFQQSDLSCAKAFIMQYSDYTNKAINKIVSSKNTVTNKPLQIKLDEILEEINNEKSIIAAKIDLSSDEDCKPSDQKLLEKETIHDSILESNESVQINDGDINVTQSSVIYVDNPTQDIVLLDSSIEENSENSNICTDAQILKEQRSSKSGKFLGKSSNIENVTCEVAQKGINSRDLDNNSKNVEINLDTDSNDDDFEDVPDVEDKSRKTIVQLTLDMNNSCEDKEDIFADIFMKPEVKHYLKTEDVSGDDISEKYHETLDNDETRSSADRTEYIERVKEDKFHKEELEKLQYVQLSSSSMGPRVITDDKLHENITTSIKNSSDVGAIKEKEITPDGNDVVKTVDIIELREPVKNTITEEKLNEMAEKVANKEQELIQEKGRLDRIGRNITEQMTKEAQELLQLFGVPYVVAPMEAEAQCAFLESANLTDGTITDDSDIWLFGGRTVYKNFFNQKKHVLQFLSERIEKSFNLTREQLVLLALLVGSDYTTGLDGIGPVTAMEILASFPYNKKQFLNETSKQGKYQQIVTGLQEFKKWVKAGKRTDNINLKKKLRNVSLTEDFPSIRVVQAYMEPNVEKSEDKFTWGDIDITILRDYTKAKFGWSQNKLDEIINPVIKRIKERKSQKTVQDYFKRRVEFQSLEDQMSKRVKAAVQKMGPETVSNEENLLESKEPIPSKKRKPNSKKSAKKSSALPGPSKFKEEINISNVVSSIIASKTDTDIIIPKTQRFQEIIPQREKDKQCILQNKMKAIELFRKTKIDRKKRPTKRKVVLPKEKAELSESSDSN
ncbi:unnamed protein product [Diatraea saccharalis]|uniref:XPG-I domain-containing protein n=1 Tax=Diatraea saccharalis TaxID=40085 RepID=A0A9P0C914_9NEOP|nr:unnamed protein product [Diatraea saccharalis]